MFLIFVTVLFSLHAHGAASSNAPELEKSPYDHISMLKEEKAQLKKKFAAQKENWQNDGPCSCLRHERAPTLLFKISACTCTTCITHPAAVCIANYCGISESAFLITTATVSFLSGAYLWTQQNESLKKIKDEADYAIESINRKIYKAEKEKQRAIAIQQFKESWIRQYSQEQRNLPQMNRQPLKTID